MMSKAIESFKAQLEEQRKHWDIDDILDYALALSDRTEFGCPAITSKKTDICMYFFELVINKELEGVPASLLEAFEESLVWDCRGPIPLSNKIWDALSLSTYTGMFYLNSYFNTGAYCMKPSMAEHLLAKEKYQTLDDEGKSFLQKVADELSVGSGFWDDFCPDLTPPYQRR